MTFEIGEKVYWKEGKETYSGYFAGDYDFDFKGTSVKAAHIAKSEVDARYYWDWKHDRVDIPKDPLELEVVAFEKLYKE